MLQFVCFLIFMIAFASYVESTTDFRQTFSEWLMHTLMVRTEIWKYVLFRLRLCVCICDCDCVYVFAFVRLRLCFVRLRLCLCICVCICVCVGVFASDEQLNETLIVAARSELGRCVHRITMGEYSGGVQSIMV